MMQGIEKFKLDEWIRTHAIYSSILTRKLRQPKCKYVLQGINTFPVSIDELRSLSKNPDVEVFDPTIRLTYGTEEGSIQLRQQIANLHSSGDLKLTAENVIIMPGSSLANYLVLGALCGPGDHIICQYPTFPPLYLIPHYMGVDVTMWKMRQDKSWTLCLHELADIIRPNTKAVILNTPNNPTGAVLPREYLLQVIEIARKSSITVLSDEIMRPLFFTNPCPPSFLTLGYTNSVVTGSMSKSYAIPGIRVGWIISQNADLMDAVRRARDYTTISVSQLDDAVAAFALSGSVLPNLLKRNISLCSEGISLLEGLVSRNPERIWWVRPAGSSSAFLQILDQDGSPVDDVAFSKKLVETEGVCVAPGGHVFANGDCDDFKGYVRINLGMPHLLQECLPRLERFIREYQDTS